MMRRVAINRLPFRAAAIIAVTGSVLLATGVAIRVASASTSSSGSSGGALARTASTAVPTANSCTIRALPTLGGPYGNAIATAANGEAVGIADDTAGVAEPVIWRSGKAEKITTGFAGSVPTSLNSHGDVVGNSQGRDNPVGWFWSVNRTVRLRDAGILTVLPAAISDTGVIVGGLEPPEGSSAEGSNNPGTPLYEQAAAWPSATSPPKVLAPLPGDQGAFAYAVDNQGRIGGVSEGTRFRPVVWDLSGKPRELPGLGGGYGIVRAFGPGGVAVGDAVARDGTDHPVTWDAAGRITDFGLPAGSRTAHVTEVLPDGVALGTAEMAAPSGGVLTQAMRWPAAGHPQLLGGQQHLGQTVASGATGVALAEITVGYRTDAKGGRHPVMWECDKDG